MAKSGPFKVKMRAGPKTGKFAHVGVFIIGWSHETADEKGTCPHCDKPRREEVCILSCHGKDRRKEAERLARLLNEAWREFDPGW